MTLYAMASVVSTSVPRSHGGCGERHDRPVKNGASVKLWSLSCPPCETELRDSLHWAPTISEIPETYDEKIEREDKEKRGQREAATATSQALDKLSSMPEVLTLLTQLLVKQNADGSAPTLETSTCPNGHESLISARFCGECGTPTGLLSAQPEPQDAAPGAESSLEDKGLPELREIALGLGVKAARSKADQIRLINEHFDVTDAEE